MKRSIVLSSSLVLNIVLAFLFSTMAYLSRDRIMDKLGLTASRTPTPEELLVFNPQNIVFSHQDLQCGYDSTMTITFLGNSLCRHAVTNFWDGERGMASSIEEKDYVHQLVKMISEIKHVNVSYNIANICSFERNFFDDTIDWNSYFSNIINLQSDYLILQIGDNVKPQSLIDNHDLYITKYKEILSRFPQSKRIMTSSLWNRVDLDEIYQNIAIETQSIYCDISHLANDNSNIASSEDNGFEKLVLSHPGDKGMLNIAKCIFSIINAE